MLGFPDKEVVHTTGRDSMKFPQGSSDLLSSFVQLTGILNLYDDLLQIRSPEQPLRRRRDGDDNAEVPVVLDGGC